MSTKAIVWIIIVVVVIGAIWWWWSMGQTAVAPYNETYPSATSTINQSSTSDNQTNGVSATSNSNAALQTDLSNIDTQMNGFSSDNANVNQGLNDQPGQQSQF